MKNLIILSLMFIVGCSVDNKSKEQDSTDKEDTAVSVLVQPELELPKRPEKRIITDMDMFHFVDSLLVGQRFVSLTENKWHYSYKPTKKSSQTIVELPIQQFNKGIDGVTVIDQKLGWQKAIGSVYRGNSADFKFILFVFPDSVTLYAEKQKIRLFSRYILHARSRIKHPNYYFLYDNYLFYFQTRASMFSGKVLLSKRKIQEELSAEKKY